MEHIQKAEDIYAVLGVTSTATPDEIKKAYYKAALKYHPDRCEEDKEQATKTFQKLGFIHSILSDPEKRKKYDQTGDLSIASEELDHDKVQMWREYFDKIFEPVTEEAVESFAAKYKGSAEEEEDIVNAYKTGDGSMDIIMDHVPLADSSEEDRYRAIVSKLFKTEVLRPTALWKKTTTKQASAARKKKEAAERAAFEKAEAAKAAKSTGRSAGAADMEALKAAIIQKHKSGFNDLITKMEAAYAAADVDKVAQSGRPASSKKKATPKKAVKAKPGAKPRAKPKARANVRKPKASRS